MHKILPYIIFILIPISFKGQNSEKPKDSIDLYIIAIEKQTRYPLPSVAILSMDDDTLVLTDENGKAKVRVLKKTKYYKATHTGHISIQIQPKRDFILNRKLGSVVMRASDTLHYGNEWKNKRHSVLFSINELPNGSVAPRYSHMLKRNNSLGAQLSLYLFNSIILQYDTESYRGFKFSPFYQYYFVNHRKGGVYVEMKLSIGYFDVKNIRYTGPYESIIYRDEQFVSAGLGSSMGFKFYIGNSVILGFSLGLQYYPLNAMKEINVDGVNYTITTSEPYYYGIPYWFSSGPGAIVDFGLYIGIKF